MYQETLRLIAALRGRLPAPSLPRVLDQLFRLLSGARQPAGASSSSIAQSTEDLIWSVWMYHPHRAAAVALDRATSDIAGRRYDIAETRLAKLVRARPDFAEAWNKRATLYYILERDDESLVDIYRTLELEPRHFGALCGFGEICLERGDREGALLAFRAALRVNPHLAGIAETCARIA